jgi:outer membrane protein OmpA-like peptidoglycan-associated protein
MMLFLLTLGCIDLIAQPNLDKSAVRKAKNLLQEGNARGAIAALEVSMQSGTEDLQANYIYGKALYQIGRRLQSLKPLSKVYTSKPDYEPDLGLMYGLALHANARYDQAIAILNGLKAQYPITSKEFLAISQAIGQCQYARELSAKPIEVTIENLGPNVNTKYDEYAPVVNADETLMLFTSRRPDNLGGMRQEDNDYYEDVYSAHFEEGQWQPAVNMKPINTEAQDAPIAVSADGQVLFIHRDDNGGDIFVSFLEGSQWTKPQNLGPPINTPFWEPSVWMSADRQRLFFVSNKPGGYGHRDIYVSSRMADGTWSGGKSLGPSVNTFMDEEAPYLHPDGKTLYFSSNGHKGMGGFDIFKTVELPDGTWSRPVNIGAPINSPVDDIYFLLSASGKHGYYASDGIKGGLGGRDIYRITFPDRTQLATEKPKDHEPASSVTLLKGKITDAKTQKALSASLIIVDNEANDTLFAAPANPETGKYLVTLTPGRNYGIIAYANGYLYCSENIEIEANHNSYLEVIKDIALQPIAPGSKIILKNIFFDFDKATLRNSSKPELSRLLRLLKNNPTMQVAIHGHTDNKGSDEYNQQLSDNRAKAVMDYLVNKGLDAKRIQAKGFGETQSIDTNDTADGRQNNRRTEFVVISK